MTKNRARTKVRAGGGRGTARTTTTRATTTRAKAGTRARSLLLDTLLEDLSRLKTRVDDIERQLHDQANRLPL